MQDLPNIMRLIGLALDQLGYRQDGTKKGKGWFGELQRPGGGVSTELSAGFGYDGKETQVPLLNPTLTQEEINLLLSGQDPTEEIYNKTNRFAQQRIGRGKSPFASKEEEGMADPQKIQQLMAMLPIILNLGRR